MIYISWLPYWHPIEDYASSRLRCLYHHNNINKYHNDEFNSSLQIHENTNILIITQKIKETDLNKIIEFKNRSIKNIIIYDIVDNYYTDPIVRKVFELCNYIFVANKIQELNIRKHVSKKVFVLEDPIDYEEYIDESYREFNNNIVWFGNNANINCVLSYLKDLAANKYCVNIIGQSNYLKNKAKSLNCIDWTYQGFIKNLKKNTIALLGHSKDQQQKSNNKLLVCIANNIPVISFNSNSYEEILKQFNLNYAIVNKRQDLIKAVKLLSQSHIRKLYLKNIKPYILENYQSKIITDKLIYILKNFETPKPAITTNIRSSFKIVNSEVSIPRVSNKRILIYTANFGGYDPFNEIKKPFKNNFDYVYVTDRPFQSKNWIVKTIKPELSGFLTAKMYKILPHRFFPEYDVSIWIDASAKDIQSNFEALLCHLNDGYNFILPKHPSRSCAYLEASTCISQNKGDPNKIRDQINKYKVEEFPENSGLYACGFLIRKHNEIIEFSEAWWNEIINNSNRDQISFPYIYNQFKDLIKLFTFNFRDCGQHFKWWRHGNNSNIKIINSRNRNINHIRRRH